MKPFVSILVPAFNAERWIGDCIKSAISQTWPFKEVVVVDDGSRDATLEIARSFSSTNVQVISQENRGAGAARNLALSLAQGDYIQWLDADDILSADKVSLQLEIEKSGTISRTLLSGAWGRFHTCPQRARFVPTGLWMDLQPAEWLFRKLDGNLWMAIESWLVSRRLIELAGPWNETLSLDDDGEYFCRVIRHSTNIRFVGKSQCFCRRGTSSLSNELTLSDQKMESQAASLVEHVRTLMSLEDSTRTRGASLKLLFRWSSFFWPDRPDLWQRMRLLSNELGVELPQPLSREGNGWMRRIIGQSRAKRARRILSDFRSRASELWEHLLCRTFPPRWTSSNPPKRG